MDVQKLRKEFRKAQNESLALSQKTMAQILENYPNPESFFESLNIREINKPGDKDFPAVYDFYKSFFTLPDETESFEGFEATLKLNADKQMAAKYGRFKECWLYATLPGTNEIIAGINFSVYELDSRYKDQTSFDATGHVIYIFVKVPYRGLGIATRLLKLAEKKALVFWDEPLRIIWFCEQNAPEKMTPEEYFADNLNALIDQCDRLIWWDKHGYKRLAFNYIQPPLNPGQFACDNLTLNVKVKNQKELPSFLVKSHLERFFLLAVFKGDRQRIDEHFIQQMQWLQDHNAIKLEGDEWYYHQIREKFYK
jgi:ribosomal protein S18 acetylase RimI-like enzyme